MQFALFAKQNISRATRWHKAGLDSWSSSDWAVAAVGEFGEMCNVIKKMNRVRDRIVSVNNSELELKEKLKMEIGDVVVYMDLIAQRHGLILEDCVRDTFNRISEREGFPERL